MKYCRHPEIDRLVSQLVQDGWLFQSGGKHGKLKTPQGRQTLTVPRSPSDHRAWLNFRRDARHADISFQSHLKSPKWSHCENQA